MKELFIIDHKFDATKKNDIERIQKEKKEYKLVDTYILKKGLRLYEYNPARQELIELSVNKKEIMKTIIDNKQLVPKIGAAVKANIRTSGIQFQALNLKNANKRIEKWKAGSVKELCNLKKPGSLKYY